jgi:hypothetical protein
VFNLSFCTFHIWTIVAIPGNLAMAANVHQFARIRRTRHVHADLKEAAMINLSAPMPDERQVYHRNTFGSPARTMNNPTSK